MLDTFDLRFLWLHLDRLAQQVLRSRRHWLFVQEVDAVRALLPAPAEKGGMGGSSGAPGRGVAERRLAE
jgi:hypothetical protein